MGYLALGDTSWGVGVSLVRDRRGSVVVADRYFVRKICGSMVRGGETV